MILLRVIQVVNVSVLVCTIFGVLAFCFAPRHTAILKRVFITLVAFSFASFASFRMLINSESDANVRIPGATTSEHSRANVELFKAAKAVEPGNARVGVTLGNRYIEDQNWSDAAAAFSAALERSRFDCELLKGRAFAYIGLGKFDLALKDLDACVRVNPEDSGAYALRGSAYMGLESTNDAIAAFSDALKFGKGAPDTYYNRGIEKAKNKDYQGALSDLNKAKDLRPSDPDIHMVLGNILLEAGQRDAAVSELTTALAGYKQQNKTGTDQGYLAARFGRARAMFAAQRYTDSLEDLDEYLGYQPADGEALLLRSEIRGALGDETGARSDRRQAFDLLLQGRMTPPPPRSRMNGR